MENIENKELMVNLKNGKYFNYGDRYFVTFNYGSEEQQRKMYELFENGLLNSYGSHSQRADEGKDYIMPYFVDEFGQVTPQDLMSIGLEKELVGRFNTYLHTDDYSKETLEKILRKSTISPLIGFKKWIEARGKQLVIDDDIYGLIAEQAYELNTGARSLQTVMNNIRTPFIKEVLRGTRDTIYLGSEAVINSNSQAMNRKGRG